jgi:hypothetical protein
LIADSLQGILVYGHSIKAIIHEKVRLELQHRHSI